MHSPKHNQENAVLSGKNLGISNLAIGAILTISLLMSSNVLCHRSHDFIRVTEDCKYIN